MKAKVDRSEFSKALGVAASGSTTRAALPILTSIRIEAKSEDGGGLVLTGCDGEIWATARISSATVEEPGALCVPQQLLRDLVAKLPDGSIALSISGTSLIVEHAGNDYRILAYPAEEFPTPPEIDSSGSLTLKFEDLREGIETVMFAVAKNDPTRAVLNGVLFQYDGQALTLVATDTHRLAVRRLHNDSLGTQLEAAVVPEKALAAILGLGLDGDATIELNFDSERMLVDVGHARVVSQLLDGSFPNWQRVVPGEHQRSWMMNREEFLENVDRSLIYARDNANRVTFKGEGEQVTMCAKSDEKGEATERITCVSENGDIEIAFNGKYLIEALKAMASDGVRTEMTEATRPAVIRPTEDGDDQFCVIMPMAL